jgi:hypothetical protein
VWSVSYPKEMRFLQEVDCYVHSDGCFVCNSVLLLLLFIWTANEILPGGIGTIIRHNTIHVTQNNTPLSNKRQHIKLHKQ